MSIPHVIAPFSGQLGELAIVRVDVDGVQQDVDLVLARAPCDARIIGVGGARQVRAAGVALVHASVPATKTVRAINPRNTLVSPGAAGNKRPSHRDPYGSLQADRPRPPVPSRGSVYVRV